MLSKRKIPAKRRKRRVVIFMLFSAVLGVSLLLLCMGASETIEADVEPTEKPLSEETTIHPQEVIEAPQYAYADVYILAKIMQAESGIDWPDWAVMCIGEVVLNRVESEHFPDTVYGVIYQGNPVQYEPTTLESWRTLEPSEDNIDLARRLMDGERVIGDSSVVWQALFPQGTQTVVTYYDKALGTTTYFCS